MVQKFKTYTVLQLEQANIEDEVFFEIVNGPWLSNIFTKELSFGRFIGSDHATGIDT